MGHTEITFSLYEYSRYSDEFKNGSQWNGRAGTSSLENPRIGFSANRDFHCGRCTSNGYFRIAQEVSILFSLNTVMVFHMVLIRDGHSPKRFEKPGRQELF